MSSHHFAMMDCDDAKMRSIVVGALGGAHTIHFWTSIIIDVTLPDFILSLIHHRVRFGRRV